MRFVYLQQLWFEIVDYFFEGIVGYEVWGGKKPEPVRAMAVEPRIQTADSFSFISLDILLEAPVLLVPVAYCSTNYLQCNLDFISVKNFYRFSPMRKKNEVETVSGNLQWFNNYAIRMENWKLRGWTLSHLNSAACLPVSADLLINWPTGPTATLNSPKWKVSCEFDRVLHLVLLKEDFALFQHIISCNLGERSRNMDEWDALQNLPAAAFESFQRKIQVHFGYDKKDGTPTTFDVAVELPEMILNLQNQSLQNIAVIRSTRTIWTYLKLSDLVGRQRLICSLTISGHEDGSSQTLLCAKSDGPADMESSVPLSYSSISSPSGDNQKHLDIRSPKILVHYQAWNLLASFFQNLSPPSYLSPDEVIQVGDRWYKIGGGPPAGRLCQGRKSL